MTIVAWILAFLLLLAVIVIGILLSMVSFFCSILGTVGKAFYSRY